ncbi:MAG: hypothetical protein ABR949_10090 [Candidatus Aquilonibacter sp.]|jgi:hypothetical protein
MPVSGLGGYDQNSAILAESFAPYVSDAVFIANRVVKVMWDNAQRHDEGRFLALPILTSLNDTAEVFGQYDTLASGPQSLYSVAQMPWSWYQTAVSLDYITVKLVRGPNMRVDNLTTQIETAIGSATNILGQDTCSVNKGRNAGHGTNIVGIYEACDAGATFDVYANIARLGSNSFAGWQGQVISLATSGLGTATNDVARSQILRNMGACVVGDAAPTHIMGHQQVISAFMFSMDSQVRLSPGDAANPYLGNPHVLGAQCIGDNHFDTIAGTGTNTSAIGYNFFYVNANHTKYRYFGEKGFDFVPWIDTPNVLEKTCRYVIGLACASDNPRLNGFYGAVNDLLCL